MENISPIETGIVTIIQPRNLSPIETISITIRKKESPMIETEGNMMAQVIMTQAYVFLKGLLEPLLVLLLANRRVPMLAVLAVERLRVIPVQHPRSGDGVQQPHKGRRCQAQRHGQTLLPFLRNPHRLAALMANGGGDPHCNHDKDKRPIASNS